MHAVFIKKMIVHCLQQYHCDTISPGDCDELALQIQELHAKEPAADLHEMVEDFVYEYLTK
ncbi:YqzH family protein [Ectobacillus ponti]|uniref:YqzH family protein n=1 Tax=Ectobacillus ponti TaxID=2961894 RepID=UPI0034D275A0